MHFYTYRDTHFRIINDDNYEYAESAFPETYNLRHGSYHVSIT